MTFKNIDAKTLKKWLENNEAIVVDVREPAEHEAEKISESNLLRTRQVASLIGLNRAERYASLEEVFEVLRPGELDGLRILLVDDTLTTGSTFLAAGAKIKAASTGKLSFLALAALK